MTDLHAAIDAGDLPPRLAALAELIGLPAMLRLVEARGGTRVYVPDVASADHWLARLIGLPAMEQLVAEHSRDYIELDRAAAALRAARDRKIVADNAAGTSTATLALENGLTQRQVFNILARTGGPVADQRDLFQQSR
ncbi:hypothetical protein [Rhodanobacter denitrificans]|uniref:Mor transcription activator domain-containing protein n=1 Tax=Rhodanobacter denitrificans TaxID=666685 RepID=M4NQN5_9GAMM|nr:hypothetical protein [Rhodanobacter denitrificans]AGG89906.1 hypothetical protein R2APBS1_2829 [Rhodanobacter denitrificans]UJM85302.1 hypothetical protein LRJ86_10980 [Rhodanobacter denitrificans]